MDTGFPHWGGGIVREVREDYVCGLYSFFFFLFPKAQFGNIELPPGHQLHGNVLLVVQFFRTDGMFCVNSGGAEEEYRWNGL